MNSRSVVAVAFVTALACTRVNAASLYVAPSGSDSNTGAIDRPFATVTKAAGVARAGDTVYVRGGVYNEIVKISSRGTQSAQIYFSSYPNERAVIDGTGTPSGTNLVQFNSAEWVQFKNFEVRNATRIGVCGWGAKNVSVANNWVHHSQKSGIWFGYSSAGVSTGNVIWGNDVYNNVLENQNHATSGGWSQAVGIQNSTNTRVIKNRVHENDGEGIVFVLSSTGLAQQNEVFDNYSVEIYLDNARATTVDANFVYSTGNTRYYRSGHPAHGIGTANEAYSTSNSLDGIKVVNNIVLHSKWGFFYGNYENGGGLKNSVIANNTFYDATVAVLNIDAAAHTGTIIQNNVFYQATGLSLTQVAGSGITYRANSWVGGLAGAAAGAGDIAGNPQFVNAGGRTAADYKLTAYSPLLNKGVANSAVTLDYFRGARTSAIDIGAHEYGTTVTSSASAAGPEEPVSTTPAPTTSRGRAAR